MMVVSCRLCLLHFATADAFAMHECVPPEVALLLCSFCRKGFKRHCYLKKHESLCSLRLGEETEELRWSGKRDGLFWCNLCDKNFANGKLLSCHKVKDHLKIDSSVTCKLCDVQFRSYRELRAHVMFCKKRVSQLKIDRYVLPGIVRGVCVRKAYAHYKRRTMKNEERSKLWCVNCKIRFPSQKKLDAHRMEWLNLPESEKGVLCQFLRDFCGGRYSGLDMPGKLFHHSDCLIGFYEGVADIPVNVCCSCQCLFTRAQGNVNDMRRDNRISRKNAQSRVALGFPPDAFICSLCWKSVKVGNRSSLDVRNGLEVYYPPRELSELDGLERKFISQLNIFCTVVALKNNENYGLVGMCKSYLSNLNRACKSQNVRSVGTDRLMVNFGQVRKWIRPHMIRRALMWLRVNNRRYYSDIDPDEDFAAESRRLRDARIDTFHQEATVDEEGIGADDTMFDYDSMCNDGNAFVMPSFGEELSVFSKPHSEALGFPQLFPFGTNTLSEVRRDDISDQNYIRCRVLNKIDTFRRCVLYLAFLLTQKDLRQITGYINLVMVQKVKNCGACITKKDLLENKKENEARRRLSCGVRTDAKDAEAILKDINRKRLKWFNFAVVIVGTIPYWKKQLSELYARIATIGDPRLFVSFSMNTFNWPDVRSLMEHTRVGFLHDLRTAIREDPVPSSVHCYNRFLKLLSLLRNMNPLGVLKNWYFRLEMQQRGVFHVHGVLWPENDYIYADTSERGREILLDYIDTIISGRLDGSYPKPLLDLINSVQRHSHSNDCFGADGRLKCGFPKPVVFRTRFSDGFLEGKSPREAVLLKRLEGDIYINNHNPMIMMYWGANHDVQIMLEPSAVLRYLTKYVTKSETDSMLRTVNDTRLLKISDGSELSVSDTIKLYDIMRSHRTLPSSEAAFRLLGYKFVHTNISVRYVNCRFPQNIYRRVRLRNAEIDERADGLEESEEDDEEEGIKDSHLFYDDLWTRYRLRPLVLEDICFFEFARDWNIELIDANVGSACTSALVSTDGSFLVRRARSPHAVKVSDGHPGTEEYFYGLLILFYPHRDSEEFAKAQFGSYRRLLGHMFKCDLFDKQKLKCLSHYQKLTNAVHKILIEEELQLRFENMEKLLEAEEYLEEDSNSGYRFFSTNEAMRFSERNPEPGEEGAYNYVCSEVDNGVVADVGGLCSMQDVRALLKRIRTCTKGQLIVLNYIMQCIKKGSQIKLCILGAAGSGKTRLLKDIMDYYRIMTNEFIGGDPILAMAYTGSAAIGLGGYTIHSALGLLPESAQYERERYDLPTTLKLKRLKENLSSKRCVVLDEVSMVSAELFRTIHHRLCAGKSRSSSDLYMGGLDLIVCGDILQLRPIIGDYIFHSPLFELLNVVELQGSPRYVDDPEWSSFLDNFRTHSITRVQLEKLWSRVVDNVDDFMSADCQQYLYSTNKKAAEHNKVALEMVDGEEIILPCIDSRSDNSRGGKLLYKTSFKVGTKRTGKLVDSLVLKIGARVSVTRNISRWVTNGTIGLVRGVHMLVDRNGFETDIVQSIDIEPEDKSKVGHKPSPYDADCINILRSMSVIYTLGGFYERRQFPLVLAYASTIHRAQGLTLSSVGVDLTRDVKWKKSGVLDRSLAYVALSRVRRFDDLTILGPVCMSQLDVAFAPSVWLNKSRDSIEKFSEYIYTLYHNKKNDISDDLRVRFGDENLREENEDEFNSFFVGEVPNR